MSHTLRRRTNWLPTGGRCGRARTRVARQALLAVLALVWRHNEPVLGRAAVQAVQRVEAEVLAVQLEQRAGRRAR
jgi:hypothetical protein